MLLLNTVIERILYIDVPNLRHLLKYSKRHKVTRKIKLIIYYNQENFATNCYKNV